MKNLEYSNKIGELYKLTTPIFAYEYNEFVNYQDALNTQMRMIEFPRNHYIEEGNIILLLEIVNLHSISNDLYKFLFYKQIYVTTINNIKMIKI